MKRFTPPGISEEFYVIDETEEYMILREVKTETNKDNYLDEWFVLDLDEDNWDRYKGSHLYIYAESFELALVCAKGIVQRNKERPVKKEVPEGLVEVDGDVPETCI